MDMELFSDDNLPTAEEIANMPISMKKRTHITYTFEVENTWRIGRLNTWSPCLNDFDNREELLERIKKILYEELCRDINFMFYDREFVVEFDDIDISDYLDIGSIRFKIFVYTNCCKTSIANLSVKTTVSCGMGSFNNGYIYIQLTLK